MLKRLLALASALLFALPAPAFAQAPVFEPFNLYIQTLPVATSPLGGTEKFYVLQGGVSKQVAASTFGNVNSVSNVDQSLTIAPTVGNVVASLNVGNPNTWTATQTFPNSGIRLLGSSTGYTGFASANSGASNFTLTFPAITDTLVARTTTDVLTHKTLTDATNTIGTGIGISGGVSGCVLYDTPGGALGCDTGLTYAGSGGKLQLNVNGILTSPAAATWQLGAADVASPVAQTLQAQSVVAGTMNTAGTDWKLIASKGTGNASPGKFRFQMAQPGTSGTSQNAATDFMTLDGTSMSFNGTQQQFQFGGTNNFFFVNFGGTTAFGFNNTALVLGNNTTGGWGTVLSFADSGGWTGIGDANIGRMGAAGTLGLTNATNPTAWQVYNTSDQRVGTPTNYERGVMDWTTSTNKLSIGTQHGGTGSARDVSFIADGTEYFKNSGSGNAGFTVTAGKLYLNAQIPIYQAASGWPIEMGGAGSTVLLNNLALAFTTAALGGTAYDASLARRAAGIVSVQNGTLASASTFQVYNTVDVAQGAPTNYERGAFDWTTTANVLTIGTQKGGTGATRNLQFVVAGVDKLDFGITNAGSWATPAQIYTGDGSTTNTAFGRTSQVNTGMYWVNSATLIAAAGNPEFSVAYNTHGTVVPGTTGFYAFSTTGRADAGAELALGRSAANTLVVGNQTTPATAMAFQVYNTSDTFPGAPTNYERLALDWISNANIATIDVQKGGTGTNRAMSLRTAGVELLNLAANGGVATLGALASGTIAQGGLKVVLSGPNTASSISWQGAGVNGTISSGFWGWTSSTTDSSGALDTAIGRNAAGVVEVDNGTAGTFRDLKLRNLQGAGAPTANSCAGFALGTGGSDLGGTITFTSATTCSITFAQTKTNAPACTATPNSTLTTAQAVPTTGGVAFTFGVAITKFQYVCIGL